MEEGSGPPARHGALLEGGSWQDRQVLFLPVTKPASLLFHSNYLPQMPKNTVLWDLQNFCFLKQSERFELFCRAPSQHLGGFCLSPIPQPTQSPVSVSSLLWIVLGNPITLEVLNPSFCSPWHAGLTCDEGRGGRALMEHISVHSQTDSSCHPKYPQNIPVAAAAELILAPGVPPAHTGCSPAGC